MRTIAAVFALTLMVGNLAMAQDLERKRADAELQDANVSPEVWAYLQELRRQDDPKLNARRAAMEKAQQRRDRLASQQWYGYSNLRPVVNPMPFMGNYSPAWSGNAYNDNYWYPAYYPSTASFDLPTVYTR